MARLVAWNGKEVVGELNRITREGLEAVGAEVARRAARNQRTLDLIDTGFSIGSYYYSTARGASTYEMTPAPGLYESRRRPGQKLMREKLAAVDVADFRTRGVVVTNAATYFVWLERKYALLFNALTSVSESDVEGLFAKIAPQRRGLTRGDA